MFDKQKLFLAGVRRGMSKGYTAMYRNTVHMATNLGRVQETRMAETRHWILDLESKIVGKIGWPDWALRTVFCLLALIVFINIFQTLVNAILKRYRKKRSKDSSLEANSSTSFEFRMFQLQYLSVYLVIMLADWLQGTNMYTLYTSYGVNVGTLFLTGFLSSAVFGTFLGIYVDSWGRKLGCIVFCLLEIVINLLEHIPSMPALLFGRVLGGLSTSLLFTAFESWMVSEHRKRGFDEKLLSSTFSISSWGNGAIAILAGFLAQVAHDVNGDIGPFQLAIILTVVCLGLVLPWRENYGAKDSENKDGGGVSDMMFSMKSSIKVIKNDPTILLLGASQAFFEGAMYTFVFMWVPSMLEVTKLASMGSLPTGLVFSCFMLAMTLGGMLFSIILPVFPFGAEGLCVFVYAMAAGAMLVPIYDFTFWSVFISFLVFEAIVGMFNSCGATLRSKYYPEDFQSSIMSVFRLPLNLLVVAGTKLTDKADSIESLQFVFGVIAAMHGIALLLQVALLFVNRGKGVSEGGDNKLKSE